MSDASKGNAKAVAVRVKSQTGGKVGGSKKHMLREMPIPKYIDQDRMHLNSVIVKPKAAAELRAICNDRRKKRETKRALKSNSAIGFEGIITFGKEAQGDFDKLTVEEQDAAYQEIAEAIAERVNSTVTGLVAHRDETAPHAHFQMPGFDLDGHPLNNTIKRGVTSEFQTIAAKVIKRHVATIERGRGKYERLKAGAQWSEVVNKSVRKLHEELPADIAKRQLELDTLLEKITKNERLAMRAAEKAAESEKAAKNAETYERRAEAAREAAQALEAEITALTAKQGALKASERRLEPVMQAVAAMDRFKEAKQEYAAFPTDDVFKVTKCEERTIFRRNFVSSDPHGDYGGKHVDVLEFTLEDTRGYSKGTWFFEAVNEFAIGLRDHLHQMIEAATDCWVHVSRWENKKPVDAAPCDPPPTKPTMSREVAELLSGLDAETITHVRSLNSGPSAAP